MFGYVKVYKPELKIKDYEAYKAVYCSLCKQLGKDYGILSRTLLSYDMTFYVLFRKSTDECLYSYKKGVCRFNPLKKCNYVCNSDEILKTASALTIMLSYYKLLDNIKDSGFLKKIIYRVMFPYIKRKYKKAKVAYPELSDIISSLLSNQDKCEKECSHSVDIAADASAKALSELFSFGIQDDDTNRVSKRFGYCLGRWVYLADAYDDIEKDLKSGNYNPFVNKYNIKNNNYDSTEIKKSLRLTANEAALALNLLEVNQYKEILENIVYDGLENQLNLISQKRGEQINE